MNAAWGAQSDFDEITLFLAKHKTTENIKHTKAFTVAFATKDTVEIADYFGVETGHKVNKIEKTGCHVHKSAHVNAPIIEEFPVTLECECEATVTRLEFWWGKSSLSRPMKQCLPTE